MMMVLGKKLSLPFDPEVTVNIRKGIPQYHSKREKIFGGKKRVNWKKQRGGTKAEGGGEIKINTKGARILLWAGKQGLLIKSH